MKIRIKFLTHRFDGGYTQICKYGDQLLVNHLHAACHRTTFLIFRNTLQTSLEIIDHRKDLFDHILCTDCIHLRFLFVSTVPEVLELCQLTLQFVSQLCDLLILFIFFLLLLTEETFFISSGILFCCLRFCLCFFLICRLRNIFCLGIFYHDFFLLSYRFLFHCLAFFHSCSAFLFMKNIVQLIHKSLQRSHNVLIIHSFGTDDTYRSLKSIPQFICGSYHTAVLHALYW